MPTRIKFLREQAFKRQHGRCFYCEVPMWRKTPSELRIAVPSAAAAAGLLCTAEHLRARRDGGADVPENIAAACAHCNHTRHKKKRPPASDVYAVEVRRRVAAGKWHPQWVFERGLI